METWKGADVLPISAARLLGDRRLSFQSLIGQNRKKKSKAGTQTAAVSDSAADQWTESPSKEASS